LLEKNTVATEIPCPNCNLNVCISIAKNEELRSESDVTTSKIQSYRRDTVIKLRLELMHFNGDDRKNEVEARKFYLKD
jgi:hypothetical protein